MTLKHYHSFFRLHMILLVFLPVLLTAQSRLLDQRNPQSMRFEEGNQPSVSIFLDEYRQAFNLSDDIQLEIQKVTTDQLGKHHRYNQFYKGIQIDGAQYVLHEKNDAVWFANGQLIHNLDMAVTPGISEETALAAALEHINAEAYMWEDPDTETFLKSEQNNPDATFYPKGELLLSSGNGNLSGKTMRLVYRFDIYAHRPLSRDWVDVDAKTGEIVNIISRIHNTNEFEVKANNRGNPNAPECTYCGATAQNATEEWISNLTFNTINNSVNTTAGYEDFTYLSTDVTMGQSYTVSVSCGTTVYYYENIWLYFDWNADCDFDDEGEAYDLGQTEGAGTLTTTITVPTVVAGPTRMRAILIAEEDPESPCNPYIAYGQVEDYTVNVIFIGGDVPGWGSSQYNGEVDMTVDKFEPAMHRLRENTTRGAPIHTFNLQNSTWYNDAVDFTATDNWGPWDPVGVSAHWGAEVTYDYFFNSFGRNSLDGQGFPLNSYVHADQNYNNAFWDGERMTYGDGDGINYNPLVCIDIVAHELTHGLTEFTSNLRYYGESGALNESFSDIFGNVVEFSVEGEPGIGTGSWRMGEDMTLVGEGGIRNMENPKEFFDPDTYYGSFWKAVNESFDNGGVHINSGVPNHWFYLLSTGGSGTNDHDTSYNVTGIGWENAASIAYHTNASMLTPYSNFYAARDASIAAAEALFGAGSQGAISTADAWDAVGVYQLPIPENDDCANAIPLSCGDTIIGNTVYATFDADVPFCDTDHTTNGVWYTIVGDGSVIEASMCGGKIYDARMTLYEGNCDELLCVAADDDGCGGYENVSKITWQSTAGTTYYILIHGFENATGEFRLTIRGSDPLNIGLNPSDLSFDLGADGNTTGALSISNNGPACTRNLNWTVYKNEAPPANQFTQGENSEDPFFAYGISPELPTNHLINHNEYHDHETTTVPSNGQYQAPSGPPVLISGSDKENNSPVASVVEPITLTHSLSQELRGVTIACVYSNTIGQYSAGSSALRSFYLPDFGVTGDFNVTEVEVGVRKATSGSGTQPVKVYLYLWNFNNTVTVIDSATYEIPDQQYTMLTLPISTTVPANSRLLAQVASPDGLEGENTFFVAANDGGQSGPSYMYAPDCSNDNYFWDMDYWGVPQVHYVLNVKGFAETTAPWLSISGGAGNTASGASDDVILNIDASGLETGTYTSQLRVNNNSGAGTAFIPVELNVTDALRLDLKVMLEGPFSDGVMVPGLADDLPLVQPYNTAPWNYDGEETLSEYSPDNVDWVLVEIRDAASAPEATADKVIGRQAALVNSSGQIVNVGGNIDLDFLQSVNENLFVVIHHRNHLSILSASALSKSNGLYSYDFTDDEGKALGGALGQKDIGSGIWGMISGDSDANGLVEIGDKTPAWYIQAGSSGYNSSDFNLDGESNNVDKNEFLIPNIGKTSQVPE